MAESVAVEIAALRARLCADTDAELAALLGLRRSAISQWKKRGRVPDRALREAEKVEATRQVVAKSEQLVRSLSATDREMCVALAAAFVVRYTRDDPSRLLRWAGMFDEVALAASRLLAVRVKMSGDPKAICFERLLADDRFFEQDLIERLMHAD